jgi:bifunctional non-homologous end joining protein LigD
MLYRPMPLVRLPAAFDDPEWLFEPKYDGFRALAHIDGHRCRLLSRRGHEFRKRDVLCEELAHAIRASSAVLDGELVCLESDGRPNFAALLFRREWPYFAAFDVLAVDGEDLRGWPLLERKRVLRRLMPRMASRVFAVEHILARGEALYTAACRMDVEGIVGKWARGRYETDGVSTSWVKVKNPTYSQMAGRWELFERRHDRVPRTGRRWVAPLLCVSVPGTFDR